VQKSRHVNFTRLATIEIEALEHEGAADIRGFWLLTNHCTEHRPNILIPKNFHPKSLESIFCGHMPLANH
jgi:hypothetical protein